jgi:hypothetical protein
MGYSTLYVFNPVSQGVYERLGWKVERTVQYGGKELAILAKKI